MEARESAVEAENNAPVVTSIKLINKLPDGFTLAWTDNTFCAPTDFEMFLPAGAEVPGNFGFDEVEAAYGFPPPGRDHIKTVTWALHRWMIAENPDYNGKVPYIFIDCAIIDWKWNTARGRRHEARLNAEAPFLDAAMTAMEELDCVSPEVGKAVPATEENIRAVVDWLKDPFFDWVYPEEEDRNLDHILSDLGLNEQQEAA
ncbi:hypothetical protein [Sinorhizobium meliloti]|uniref:hypothetical protein n=1 Tax=Rhizobium meliloti TaxID=382 RepID=UPI00398D4C7C